MLWAIEGTLSTEFVTESKRTRRSSDFLPVHCWCFQFLPQRLNVHVRRYRGTVSVSLPATLWQIWSPNLLFCCKKGLTPELWMLRKALSCHRSAVSSCLEAADSSLSHCHNSSVAASWTPVHLQPNAFLFFLFPLLLYPEPTSSLTAITIFPNRVLEWGEKNQTCLCPLEIWSLMLGKIKNKKCSFLWLILVESDILRNIQTYTVKNKKKRNVCLPAKHQRVSFVTVSMLAC